jgi:serine/threonine-protein kinase PpkA
VPLPNPVPRDLGSCVSSSSTILLQSVDISIPGFKILRPIGEGGMASVFLAMQESLDREVALKVMAPALAANSEFTERFLKEGRITAKLQHQNLVTVYDIGAHGGVYYLAAEYIPGGTLKERITEGGLSVGEILDIVVEMARGLDFAHQKGFVHRDVKPGNILFRKDGSVVLADFGIAKAMDSSSSSTVAGASIGTPDYMSPEQARAEPVDGRSDLYSLGTVLYEMLTGAPPYQAADPFTVALMHVTQPIPQLPAEFAWLQPLIDRTMNKQPAERVQTGALLAEEVHQLLTKSPQGATTLSKVASKGQARISSTLQGRGATVQRTRIINRDATYPGWLWPAVGGGVAVVAVVLWLLLRSPAELPPAKVLGQQVQPVTMTASGSSTIDDVASGGDKPNIIQPKTFDEQYGGDLQQMLDQADAYKNHGITSKVDIGRNLVGPPGSNAVELYQKVLTAKPGDQHAVQGLQDIAAFYTSFSQRTCDARLFDACKTNAENGLLAEPDNQKLKDLEKQADDGSRGISSGN